MSNRMDFDSILHDLTSFQREIGKIHTGLTNARQKEALGAALKKIEEARADVEAKYATAMTAIEQSALQSQQRAKAGLARVASVRDELAAVAAPPTVEVPKPDTEKFDGQPGDSLGAELLARLADQPAATDAPLIEDREIWEDWDWNQQHVN